MKKNSMKWVMMFGALAMLACKAPMSAPTS